MSNNPDDIIWFSEGDWAFRNDLSHVDYEGYDYKVLPFESEEWNKIVEVFRGADASN